MINPVLVLLAAVVGYLLGSLSFARWIGRWVMPGEDITKTEFAIPGMDDKLVMTSVSATGISLRAGPKFGCLTSILDMLKVTLPTLAFRLWLPEAPYFLIAAGAGVVGHNWPVYHRFQGGRGFSPVFGGMLVIDWLAIPVTSLIGILMGLVAFRDVLVAYMSGMWLMVPWLWLRTHDWAHLAYAVAINIFFMVAMLPELKQYIRLKREGKADLSTALQATDMRHMLKMANRLGLLKEDKS
jgi:glycerol-3-phosphate acyltransferase PlsY